MTSGIPFSAEEQVYILAHAYSMTWGAIARELSARFGVANGGRSGYGVRSWVRRREDAGGIVTVRTRVPRDLLAAAGVQPQDVEAVLAETLRARGHARA